LQCQVENPFNWAKKLVKKLQEEKIKNIFIDFHGEATSEKRIMLMMFKNQGKCNLWNTYSCRNR
jgi:calcineurin-like phosphoesterase